MTTDEFIQDVREMEAMLPGCFWVEKPVEDLIPVVQEIEALRNVAKAAREFILSRDVGDPTPDLADAFANLDRLKH